MSAKWIQAKRWDDQHLPRFGWPLRSMASSLGARTTAIAVTLLVAMYGVGAGLLVSAGELGTGGVLFGAGVLAFLVLLPIKALLRAFSSIALAVVLLSFVALYGTLASVPIGMLAKVPGLALYGLAGVVCVGGGTFLLTFILHKALRAIGASSALRFSGVLLGGIVIGVGAVWLWAQFAWPAPEWATGMFGDFAKKYEATTIRRLPILEMSELEFYAWWPLRVVLLAFVANMVVATFRRIEFSFPNLGVLTVHTGIVVIALGSVYYGASKREGDMLLQAGDPSPDGMPTIGPADSGFYDDMTAALWVIDSALQMRQFPLPGLPRYNDYNLGAVGGVYVAAEPEKVRSLTGLSIPVQTRFGDEDHAPFQDVSMRVVGFANYAEPVDQGIPVESDDPRWALTASRRFEILGALPETREEDGEYQFLGRLDVDWAIPAGRVATGIEGALVLEATRGMSEERWNDLATTLPASGDDALIIEVPEAGFREVIVIEPGMQMDLGETGWSIGIESILDEPDMPLITEGYQGASSSLVKVRVTPPLAVEPAFTRWVYHRFPEIGQDMLDAQTPDGRPMRKDPDERIRLSYIDASRIHVYLDERADDGGRRAIVRLPGAADDNRRPIVIDEIGKDADIPVIGDVLVLREEARLIPVEVPRVVPEHERDRARVGNRSAAMIAVEVKIDDDSPSPAAGWRDTRWLPFGRYARLDAMRQARNIVLPDGRSLNLLFGRQRHRLPGLSLRLVDFEMDAYAHSMVERDFISTLEITRRLPGDEGAEVFRDITSMNNPLSVQSKLPRQHRGGPVGSAIGGVVSAIAPDSYKFSQAGWDSQTWNQTKEAVDRGELPRPLARFTILGVGNNPGIRVIALGSVMMSIGIPWAFYIKPLIMRRRKKKIQQSLKRDAIEAGRAGQEGVES